MVDRAVRPGDEYGTVGAGVGAHRLDDVGEAVGLARRGLAGAGLPDRGGEVGVDVLIRNWYEIGAAAEGLRGSENLDVEFLVRTLNGWAYHVESETKRNLHRFTEHPEEFKNSLAYFRMGMIGTVTMKLTVQDSDPPNAKGNKTPSQSIPALPLNGAPSLPIHGTSSFTVS